MVLCVGGRVQSEHLTRTRRSCEKWARRNSKTHGRRYHQNLVVVDKLNVAAFGLISPGISRPNPEVSLLKETR